MAAAGRGGSSDVGQRIRDEILAVQSRNECKVGQDWGEGGCKGEQGRSECKMGQGGEGRGRSP